MFGRCHRRLQDRAGPGEPADRSRDMPLLPLRHAKVGAAMPAELGQHALVAAARGGDRKLKGTVLLTSATGSATASASGTGVSQWPGIRRLGTV